MQHGAASLQQRLSTTELSTSLLAPQLARTENSTGIFGRFKVSSGAGMADGKAFPWRMEPRMQVLTVAPEVRRVCNDATAENGDVVTWEASSTLKKRRLKMNKHKYRKRRKRDRRRTKL